MALLQLLKSATVKNLNVSSSTANVLPMGKFAGKIVDVPDAIMTVNIFTKSKKQ